MVDLGGLTPDPERQLLEFGAGVSIEIDAADGDAPADAVDEDAPGEEWEAA